jgi:hypothetical protein
MLLLPGKFYMLQTLAAAKARGLNRIKSIINPKFEPISMVTAETTLAADAKFTALPLLGSKLLIQKIRLEENLFRLCGRPEPTNDAPRPERPLINQLDTVNTHIIRPAHNLHTDCVSLFGQDTEVLRKNIDTLATLIESEIAQIDYVLSRLESFVKSGKAEKFVKTYAAHEIKMQDLDGTTAQLTADAVELNQALTRLITAMEETIQSIAYFNKCLKNHAMPAPLAENVGVLLPSGSSYSDVYQGLTAAQQDAFILSVYSLFSLSDPEIKKRKSTDLEPDISIAFSLSILSERLASWDLRVELAKVLQRSNLFRLTEAAQRLMDNERLFLTAEKKTAAKSG